MRAIVAGGAGFLGTHLCVRLLNMGWEVTAVDSMITGRQENFNLLQTYPRFRPVEADVADWWTSEPADVIFHLASPASPKAYLAAPRKTLEAGSTVTLRLLDMAERKGAVLFLASTSEVYGSPLEHPQSESYWGNVNPVGPRAVYDESKRFAEAAVSSYAREGGRARIVRIFNTYGPLMHPTDGRAIPQFITQALAGEPITVQGDGQHTRSFLYVDDLIEGFIRLLDYNSARPMNLGGWDEVRVLDLAYLIRTLTKSDSPVIFEEAAKDDPPRRRADCRRAEKILGWAPQVELDEGLEKTIVWFKEWWR